MRALITFLSLIVVFSSFTVEARTKHKHKHHKHHRKARRGSPQKHAAYMRALGNKMPERSISKGQCDVKIDCPRGEIVIDGQSLGKINCGPQTGSSFKNKTVRLTTAIIPAGGRILPPGFPMLATSPMLCDNCFIHVYPWVHGRSLGCVGVSPAAWKKITQCGGSEIAFITKKGVKSAVPESMMAKKSAPVSKKPTYEANAEQAGAPSSGSF
jgi:hypothetical protein